MTDFAFATCLPGLEPALKLDVQRTSTLRFAYSRPGLVTFKSTVALRPDDKPGSVFARVWGISVGAASDPDDAARQLAARGVSRVHVFARDTSDERERVVDLAPWHEGLRDFAGGPATVGDLVGDVIVADDGAWLGVHVHDEHHVAEPGGLISVEMPADAPSRAYAKIEEAIAWAALPVKAGQVALEIGAAPGGAVMALARRGLEVFGVDTGDLAPQVMAMPGVHHLAMKVGALRWEMLPERVDWLLVDVNLAPQVALHEVGRLMPKLKRTLQGAVFTLKLNDWSFVPQLPMLEERIRGFGFSSVRMRHLPSNRREICVIARSS